MMTADSRTPTASLADVDILSQLSARPARVPDYEREHQALARLATEMAADPRNMLQTLVEIAAALCGADTAGISLLDGDVFRWEAVAGVFAAARGGTMPRLESPCGVCIDRNAAQLMHLADRCFPALRAEPRFVEALLIPFHARGVPIGTVWIVSHTADRQFDQADERIVSLLAQFASAGWQLWQACDATAAANRHINQFVGTLGHELRNPLAAMTAAVALLDTPAASEDMVRRATAVVGRQTRQMSRLIDDLLDMTRIARGKMALHKTLVDLRTVVEESVEANRSQLETRGHGLTVALGTAAVYADADPVRIAQIVSNLIENAAKYTSSGGQITVALAVSGNSAEIAVADNGIGLPAEQLQHIFEPFVQLRDVPDRSGGLGLGLSLVRELVAIHGGDVTATSAGAGQGSCFTVRLPMRPIAGPTTSGS